LRKNLIALTALLTISITALTGCAMSSPNMGQSSQDSMMTDESGTFSSNDIMFAQMMIPHHQQALDMSELALAIAQDPDVIELAAQISQEQGPEISQMRSWLSSAGASEDMGHGSHGMGGMLSEEQMSALLEASSPEFERLFLEGMIAHHEGAIDMAQMVLQSENAEVRALAEAIVSSQQIQIDYMKSLLAR
jgi:uncharacterized protein (DUF305 family)